LISKEGRSKELFLGAAEPPNRGAEGELEALKAACTITLNQPDAARRLLRRAS